MTGLLKKIIIYSYILLFSSFSVFSGTNDLYPVIERMDVSDVLFHQITEDISGFYQNTEQNKELNPLRIYRIILKENSTVFGLAARFNIPYETITTLNRLNQPVPLEAGTELLIPNTPGLFIPLEPVSDLEYMMGSWRNTESAIKITIGKDTQADFLFIPGDKFHKVERAFFLGIMFRFPLPIGSISSGFGNRIHPLAGTNHFHNGIDIAAPSGTEVMASRAGFVKIIGYDDICGNYIVISHENGYETVYCHLKKIIVQLNQQVQSGMIIGMVGNTGMSTGSHLHFEIRSQGDPKDPILMLPGKSK